MPTVWERSADLLAFTARAFELRIYSYVLMQNHYHLIVGAPLGNLPEAMCYFQGQLSRLIGQDLGRTNHIFGAPYFASLINEQRYLEAVYKYVYRNPVEAGASQRVQDYPFSTLRMLMGLERTMIPVVDPLDFTSEPERILHWLNQSFEKEQKECFQKGLKRSKFEFKPGENRVNRWTDDLVFKTNALQTPNVGRTFG